MPESIDACDGSVELGKMVCALRLEAPEAIKASSAVIGVSSITSGRSPSKLMISTRDTSGAGVGESVGVRVGSGVKVAVGAAVDVKVADGSGVSVGGEKSAGNGSRQEVSHRASIASVGSPLRRRVLRRCLHMNRLPVDF
jgi:hypothetical protein